MSGTAICETTNVKQIAKSIGSRLRDIFMFPDPTKKAELMRETRNVVEDQCKDDVVPDELQMTDELKDDINELHYSSDDNETSYDCESHCSTEIASPAPFSESIIECKLV